MSSMYPPASGQTVQSCARCGLPLLPDVPVCRNCGWYNALPPQPLATNNPGMPVQNQQSNIPFQNQQNNYAGYTNPQPGMYYAAPTVNTNTYQPPTNMYQAAPPAMNGYAPGNYYEPPPEKRGPNVGLILMLAILLVIIVGGGSFAAYFFLIKNNNQTPTTPTPTAAIVTPSVKPLFSDSFENNNTGWDLTSSAGKYSVSVGNGHLLLEDDDNKLLWDILPGKSFADFRLDVDATLTKGSQTNGYGVFIRGTASQDSDIGLYYRFELYSDGTFALFKGTLDANGNTQSTQVTNYIANAAIQKAGLLNHITVIARGISMTFMVNGKTVYTYTDDLYKGGEVALFVSNLPGSPKGAQASFAHLAIFPAS